MVERKVAQSTLAPWRNSKSIGAHKPEEFRLLRLDREGKRLDPAGVVLPAEPGPIRSTRRDSGGAMTTMWNQRAEAMSPDERAALQSERLGALVTRLLDRSPLYRRRLAEAGVEAGE